MKHSTVLKIEFKYNSKIKFQTPATLYLKYIKTKALVTHIIILTNDMSK